MGGKNIFIFIFILIYIFFKCNTTTVVPRAGLGKRKRSQGVDEDTRGQENICPNSSGKVTPKRREKGTPRAGQTRLFQQKEEQSATPPKSKAKGKQHTKTSTQTGECVSAYTVNPLSVLLLCLFVYLCAEWFRAYF